jgi:hypothetical protein
MPARAARDPSSSARTNPQESAAAVLRLSPARGRPIATLPPLVAAKLALYEAMRAQQISRTELARRLRLQENAVRRLLDLDHRSHIDQIDRGLAALGKRLGVQVLESASPLTGNPRRQWNA